MLFYTVLRQPTYASQDSSNTLRKGLGCTTLGNDLQHTSLQKNSYSSSFLSYPHSDPSYSLPFAIAFRAKKNYFNCNMQSKVKAADCICKCKEIKENLGRFWPPFANILSLVSKPLIHPLCMKSTTSNIPHIVWVALTKVLTEDVKTIYKNKKNLLHPLQVLHWA